MLMSRVMFVVYLFEDSLGSGISNTIITTSLNLSNQSGIEKLQEVIREENTLEKVVILNIQDVSDKRNDWIPLESGMYPSKGQRVLVTIESVDGKLSTEYTRFYGESCDKGLSENIAEYRMWGIDESIHGSRVIAWRPINVRPYRKEKILNEKSI